MAARRLHLAAYDIRHPRRLRRCLRVLKDYASGGQKSVFECYLSACEVNELMLRMAHTMDERVDRFLLVPLMANHPVATLGVAVAPTDPDFFYVG